MASTNVLAAFVLFALALPMSSRATQHIVGDELGWTPGFNYTVWAQGKEFRVGDTLVFKYTVRENSVFKVDGPQFQQCAFPPMSEAMTTGNDVVTLATEGRKWYISGAGNGANCRAGQRLVITVLPAVSPSGWESTSPSEDDHAPAPSPSDGPAPTASHWSFNRFLKY